MKGNNIPDFQTLMLPLLKLLGDSKIHSLNDVMEKLAQHYSLTENDLRVKVPSGQMGLFRNRIGWSRSYLKYAGLIEYPSRGNYKITYEGLKVLSQNPTFINIAYLKQFPKFQEWQNSYSKTTKNDLPDFTDINKDPKTPDESLGESLVEINQQVTADLLDILTQKKPEYFERFVLILLDRMGYGGVNEENFEVVGKSNDGGIDGIIYQDQLGLDRIYVQAKKWKDVKISPADIRDFIGALNLKGASKGVFITTSKFSKEARSTAVKNPHNRVVLIDGPELAALAIKYNVGVQVKKTFELKGIDQDFFEEDSTL